jgi:predicted ATPase
MGTPIDHLTIKGFKSIRELNDFKLQAMNILIGPNGAGKSNFIGFFKLLREMVEQRLQLYVGKNGGADSFLYMGPKVTDQIIGKIYFKANGYEFILEPTLKNQLIFSEEAAYFAGVNYPSSKRQNLGSGQEEAKLKEKQTKNGNSIVDYVYPAISSWVVYHFHDTSDSAAVKRRCSIRDNEYLRSDAANLAPFLKQLQSKHESSYNLIRDTVRLVAPFFHDFKLRPTTDNPDETELEWTQNKSDYPFHASQLSDGTLRFICLATALLQPVPPSIILIDEPELGLHPYALTLLASLLKQASQRTQVIVSTQSALLLDYFSPEDIIVVDRLGEESIFTRPNEKELEQWLEEYSLGELWQKNLLGGRPGK